MAVSILGVVLAGGQARRMENKEKGLMQFKGKALCDYAIEALTPFSDKIVINANSLSVASTLAYEASGCSVFSDSQNHLEKGPLSGLYAALLVAEKEGFSHVLLSPCDTPYVVTGVFDVLKKHTLVDPEKLYFIESTSGIQPLHTIIPVTGMRSKLDAFLQTGERKVMIFYQKCNAQVVAWQNEDCFTNINHLDQLTA